jgi:hypothetical protein
MFFQAVPATSIGHAYQLYVGGGGRSCLPSTVCCQHDTALHELRVIMSQVNLLDYFTNEESVLGLEAT